MKTDVGRRAGPLLVFCMNSTLALSRTPTTMLSRANMPPHPMFQKQKPSLGWMPSRRNATGSCMQRSAKTCGKPLNLSCRQERDVRSSVSMMVSAPYCVLKSLYAGKRATERAKAYSCMLLCCERESVCILETADEDLSDQSLLFRVCLGASACAASGPSEDSICSEAMFLCVRNVCIAWHHMHSATSMRMCACCMHSVDRPVSFCVFHMYSAYLHVSNVHTYINSAFARVCVHTNSHSPVTHQHAREDLCGARYRIDIL